jgi:hypothetical protein
MGYRLGVVEIERHDDAQWAMISINPEKGEPATGWVLDISAMASASSTKWWNSTSRGAASSASWTPSWLYRRTTACRTPTHRRRLALNTDGGSLPRGIRAILKLMAQFRTVRSGQAASCRRGFRQNLCIDSPGAGIAMNRFGGR